MLTFTAIDECRPGRKWRMLLDRLWPGYERWYCKEGSLDRPTYLACRRALERHMPEFVPVWSELCELAGGGDIAARFLSLYCPPGYVTGCSQAVWPGPEPLLVRNYDYNPQTFDAVLLNTRWLGKRVMGMSDCLVGLVDGINEDGLALSLTFGGRRVVGLGFGVPIVIRYVLETCTTAEEAARTLARIPTHMAYNVTALDGAGERRTVFLSPDREPLITHAAVATNHQERVEWGQHARATATVERERFLLQRLTLHEEPPEDFIGAFLKPPLYSLAFARGFGTLYTAVYWPRQGTIRLCWPGAHWPKSLHAFEEGSLMIHYPVAF